MNLRQKKYRTNRLAGMNQHNAAIAAGYSETYSKQACRVERLVKVSILDTLEQAGLTDKYQANELYKLTLSDNEKVRLEALKHISDLKNQISSKPLIDNSIHVTGITLDNGENNRTKNNANTLPTRISI